MDFSLSSTTTVSFDVSTKQLSHYTSATPESLLTGYSDPLDLSESPLLFSSSYVPNSPLPSASSPSVADLHYSHNISISSNSCICTGDDSCNTACDRRHYCYNRYRQDCPESSTPHRMKNKQHTENMDSHMAYTHFETSPKQHFNYDKSCFAKVFSDQLVSTPKPSLLQAEYQMHQLQDHGKLLSPSTLDDTTDLNLSVTEGAITGYGAFLELDLNTDLEPSSEFEESQLPQELQVFQQQDPHHPYQQQQQQQQQHISISNNRVLTLYPPKRV
ncbi:hypothetical protein PICMEDRAFT_117889 [Pichia membranifaciens NRRL Y-2026]|uniref:Uncharacterized protein n=1 Tax=Pichia membranifaciens NRRL Y-2026 TaxID=763406 RepID=A0A1E3NNK9_9ASCO|nr:hypothetical protein PICMEDRAFT_117889 [Pichia membranifaciens NRRL Y-2026]ODQ47690.1 hypothetical protein PICMEDRAFT_117889 [Pichia membranifaciens NRRL Y-2026]